MNYEKFVRNNRAKKVTPDKKQIRQQIKRSVKDLKTADYTLPADTTWALTIAYHAMIRAGRALMFSRGYLPTAQATHKTIVDFTAISIGDEYADLAAKFNRLRRRRHHFIYDSKNHVNESEAKGAIRTAQKLVDTIVSLIS